MTDTLVHIARRRLALGISNVGFWVLVSLAGLVYLTRDGAWSVNQTGLLKFLLAAVAVQSLFDLVGGFFLMPPAWSASKSFGKRWFRGVFTHSALLCAAGFLNYWSFRWSNSFSLGVVTATLLLFFSRPQVLRLVAGTRVTRATFAGSSCWSAESLDPSFTGATCGLGAHAMPLIPDTWKTQLTASQLQTVLQRRLWEITSNLPARSLLFVLLWNLLGCGIGSAALSLQSRPAEHAMLLQFFWMTLWGFVGLLILPALSRSTVFGADRAAAANGCDVQSWIREVPAITGEDGSSKMLLQRIFYPIPSTGERLRHLETHAGLPVLGNVARTNLFLSLATFTLLGRCVHCNVGRPELWVFPPSD